VARACRRAWGTTTTNVTATSAADVATATDVTATHITAATHVSTAYVTAIINASSATHMTAATAGDAPANRMRCWCSATMETRIGCRRAIDISTRIG